MATKEQALRIFKKNIDDLISSNYVLAPKKISVLLKNIASSKLFFELIEFCTENYNYELAKSVAIKKGDSYTDGSFTLPKDSRQIIAFVFSLLYEIDCKKLDFTSLIVMCFYNDSYNESFKRFCREVIVPFREEVVITVNRILGMSEEVEIKPQQSENSPNNNLVSVEKVEKPALNSDDAERIKTLLIESKSIILQYKMDAQIKAELMCLYDDFSSALYGTDSERIKLSFLGYKYSTLHHRKLDVSVGKIEKILKESGIL